MSNIKTGRTVGYVRVSTEMKNADGSYKQKFDRQLAGIELDEVFTERASGAKKENRPELKCCMDFLVKGDTLVVHEVSRLARSTLDLLDIITTLVERGVIVKFIKNNITYGTGQDDDMNTMILTMLGAVATFERSIIKSRISEGIQAKIAKGGSWGGHHPKAAEKLRENNEKRMEEKVQKERPHVEVIKDLVAKGLKMAEVARRMTEYGLMTETGKEYNSGSVSRFIKRHGIEYKTSRYANC